MEKQKAMTYQEALEWGIVKEGHYFLVKYPDGREVLFRLVKRNGKYVMWGMKTTQEILLNGKEGYDNFLTLADVQVKKEYSSKDVFEEIHALGLSETDYEISSWKELNRILNEARIMYVTPKDANMSYALASRCVWSSSSGAYFSVFYVGSGCVSYCDLYYSDGSTRNGTFAVRPEATSKSTLLLKIDGCDGTKSNPWICLNSQEGVQEVNTPNDGTTGESVADASENKLMQLIQEGHALIEQGLEWITKLEQYAKNLK